MELLDLYDSSRAPLGRRTVRGTPLSPGEFILVAVVWTADGEGNILLTKRAPEKKYLPNEWENSGGAVRSGETSLEGAVRELGEETGLRVPPGEFVLLGSCLDGSCIVDTYFVRLDRVRPGIRLQPGETVDYRWMPFADFTAFLESGAVIEPAVRQVLPYLGRIRGYLEELPKKKI